MGTSRGVLRPFFNFYSGTDSPFRETSNIYDGSAVTADMAVQNCIGTAACTKKYYFSPLLDKRMNDKFIEVKELF